MNPKKALDSRKPHALSFAHGIQLDVANQGEGQMELKIEKGVPMPTPRINGIAAALRKMKKGDSVFIPGGHIGSVINNARQTLGAGHVTARTEEGGIRVWRIK